MGSKQKTLKQICANLEECVLGRQIIPYNPEKKDRVRELLVDTKTTKAANLARREDLRFYGLISILDEVRKSSGEEYDKIMAIAREYIAPFDSNELKKEMASMLESNNAVFYAGCIAEALADAVGFVDDAKARPLLEQAIGQYLADADTALGSLNSESIAPEESKEYLEEGVQRLKEAARLYERLGIPYQQSVVRCADGFEQLLTQDTAQNTVSHLGRVRLKYLASNGIIRDKNLVGIGFDGTGNLLVLIVSKLNDKEKAAVPEKIGPHTIVYTVTGEAWG